jgi:hypothetical protein
MAIDPRWLEDLPRVPEVREEQGWRSEVTEAVYRVLVAGVDDSLRVLSLYWTMRLAEESERWHSIATGLPGFFGSEVGFLAVDESSPLVDRGRVGVTLLYDDPASGSNAEASPPLLLDPENDVRLGRYSFPIVTQPATFTPQLHISNPLGSVACWAKARASSQQPREGWLTAEHVLSGGTTVTFSDLTPGTLVDKAGGCADIAVVSPPDKSSAPATPLRLSPVPTMGTVVNLYDQTGASKTATVKGINDTFAGTPSKSLPVTFSMDDHGTSGDSGSFIEDVKTKDFVGMYLGTYNDKLGTGSKLGVGLAALYVAGLMDMECYR